MIHAAATDESERLAASYRACSKLAQRAASSFYLSFWLLPKRQRLATCALYAFYRHTDNLVDAPSAEMTTSARHRALDHWKTELEKSLRGDYAADMLLAAVADTTRRYQIPPAYLFAAIDGVRMDLAGAGYETAADLETYCYRVASVVGLACIHVWGFHDDRAIEAATQCGYAFQWTNILRDCVEDARTGRIYLPRETIRQAGSSPDDLLAPSQRERLAHVIAEESARAKIYFDRAAPLTNYLSRDGKRVFSAMFRTYRELLDRVERAGGGILDRRVRIPAWRKAHIAASALFDFRKPVMRVAAGQHAS